ncbi:DUF4435 domain-containing protein [Pectobacterium brasiliense]|uniref:DUF4435 domain-containing protein n=1 Tax=Pectobacterium brasiliense TaxID=180957 RepID=UPI00057ECFD7|nr:DUF4435 domain-containing protein [Pectobacterium brasiliense]KHT37970.1 hypothetical protein RD02_19715 [Pectobacterium brasiliense]
MSRQFTDYLTNANYVRGYNFNQKGIVYIENERDYVFWESLFNECHPGKYEFKSSFKNDGTRGKDILKKIYLNLNEFCLAAVDGDFDYICSSFREISRMLTSQYVVHTYCYSRESAIFSQSKINELVSKVRLTDKCSFDVFYLIKNISNLQYDLLIGYLFLLEQDIDLAKEFNPHRPLKKCEFRKIINKNFTVNEKVLQNLASDTHALKEDVYKKIDTSSSAFQEFKANATAKGFRPETTYRYISGHVLNDNIILPLFTRLKYLMELKSIANISSENTKPEDKKNMIAGVRKHYRESCRLKTIINGLTLCENDEIYIKIKEKISSIH